MRVNYYRLAPGLRESDRNGSIFDRNGSKTNIPSTGSKVGLGMAIVTAISEALCFFLLLLLSNVRLILESRFLFEFRLLSNVRFILEARFAYILCTFSGDILLDIVISGKFIIS